MEIELVKKNYYQWLRNVILRVSLHLVSFLNVFSQYRTSPVETGFHVMWFLLCSKLDDGSMWVMRGHRLIPNTKYAADSWWTTHQWLHDLAKCLGYSLSEVNHTLANQYIVESYGNQSVTQYLVPTNDAILCMICISWHNTIRVAKCMRLCLIYPQTSFAPACYPQTSNNCKTRRETFKFWIFFFLLRLILRIRRQLR